MASRIRAAKKYATVAEAAYFTGLSEGTIRNLLATQELTAYRPVPGRIVLDLQEVEKFVRNSAGRQGTRGCKPHGLGIDECGSAVEALESDSRKKGGGATQRNR